MKCQKSEKYCSALNDMVKDLRYHNVGTRDERWALKEREAAEAEERKRKAEDGDQFRSDDKPGRTTEFVSKFESQGGASLPGLNSPTS